MNPHHFQEAARDFIFSEQSGGGVLARHGQLKPVHISTVIALSIPLPPDLFFFFYGAPLPAATHVQPDH